MSEIKVYEFFKKDKDPEWGISIDDYIELQKENKKLLQIIKAKTLQLEAATMYIGCTCKKSCLPSGVVCHYCHIQASKVTGEEL